MKPNTFILVLSILIITIIITVSLYFIYEKETNLIFDAEVIEVFEGTAIIIPLPGELMQGEELSGNITDVDVGDILRVEAKQEVRETFPLGIDVVKYEIIDR